MIHETNTNDYFGYDTKSWENRTGRLSEEGRGNEGSCKSCLPCFIAVVLDFRDYWETRIKRIAKINLQKSDILISGGRNLQGRNRKGPKPLGVKSEKGRNLWQPH